MRFQGNPAYRPVDAWELSARGRVLWRAVLLVLVAGLIVTGRGVGLVVLLVLWIAAEVALAVRSREKREDPGADSD